RGEQTDDVVALDERAALVEQEAAIVVAVPGAAAIGAMPLGPLDRRDPVRLQHRIRHAVRERAVRRMIDLDELERQMRLELIDDQPGAAVAGVDDELEL